MDNDGDLDIAVVPFDAPPVLYKNLSTRGNSIAFELRDSIGNYFGVGSKLVVSYGNEKRLSQIRELKASGGYLSFDAPVLHFGLGEFDHVSGIEIIWSTGERTVMDVELDAGWTYRIYRNSPPNLAATASPQRSLE